MKESPFIGQLDRRVAISYTSEIKSTTGENVKTTVSIDTVWAQYKDKSGNLSQDEKVVHVNTREYMIRYRAEIWAKRLDLLLTDDGLVYRIYHAEKLDRNKFIKLTATIYE